jgi:hypothetical protein
MKRKSRPLTRRPPRLHPRKRILVICEGAQTEPSYFSGLKNVEQARAVEVEIDDSGGVPKTLVERAVERKRSASRAARSVKDQNLLYDEIWCVFDVDEHPKLEDSKQQALAHAIKLAISNPCFELWLLLHFRDHRSSIERHLLQAECRICMPKFVKSVDFNQLKDRVDAAVERAIQLEKWQTERYNFGQNPSTTVHKLVQTIKVNGRQLSMPPAPAPNSEASEEQAGPIP